MENNIMVSICCLTFNHENYIREALDSMLTQKTNFKFEILIHDDASTDRTGQIIKDYQKKNPDIIKPILQKENQFSKGVSVFDLNTRRAEGKYIAMCEGDDYWIDKNKLQKQVDYMEANPKCTFCFHNAEVINQQNMKKERLVIPWLTENKSFFYSKSQKYDSGELQLLGFIPTASFMYPRYVLDNLPDWYFKSPVGDNPLKLLASSKGYAYYIHEVMSIYRFNVPGSATTKWNIESKDVAIKRIEDFIEMLDSFNHYTNYRYNQDIQVSKLTWKVQKNKITLNNKALKDHEYQNYFTLLPMTYRLKIYFFIHLPKVYNYIKRFILNIQRLFKR